MIESDDGMFSMMYGRRVARLHPLQDAIGDIDELSSSINLIVTEFPDVDWTTTDTYLKEQLRALRLIMGSLSVVPVDRERYMNDTSIEKLTQQDLDRLRAYVLKLHNSLLIEPGFKEYEVTLAAKLNIARAIARRCQRSYARIDGFMLAVQYLDNLSDFLWYASWELELAYSER